PGETKQYRDAEAERDQDRQRDQGHHSREAGLQLLPRPLEEYPSTVDENDGPEDRRNPLGAGEGRTPQARERGEHVPPDHRRDREGQRDPELRPEHLRAVAGMVIVAAVPMSAVPMAAVHVIAAMVVGACTVTIDPV